MKRRVLAMLLLLAMVLSMIPAVGAEAAAEHHLLLADDFTPGGWTKETAKTAHGPLSANTLKGHTESSVSAASATAAVTVTNAGSYHVWAHVLYHQAAELSATSWKTKVAVNGTKLSTVFGGHHDAADAYVWVDGGVAELTAGVNTVALDDGEYNDYARADGIWLTSTNLDPRGKSLAELQEAAANESQQPGYLDDGMENVVDNREKDASGTGDWKLAADAKAYLGDYAVSPDANASFTWTLTIPENASYDLAWYSAAFYASASMTDKGVYTLTQNGVEVGKAETNQSLADGWHPLFSAELKAGTAQLTLTNGGSKPLMADAVRVTRTLVAGETTMTLDNLDANAVHSGAEAQWIKGLKVGTCIGADYELATGENSDSTFFRWPVEVYGAGWWKVEAYLPEGSGQTDLSSAVSYEIVHKNKTDAVTLDHSTKTGWTELGCWEFTGDAESISVIPAKGQAGWAYVDAVRLTYMGQNDPNAEYWIVDNTDKNTIRMGTFPSGTGDGWQNPSTYRAGYVGDNYYSLKSGDPEASFTWQFRVPKNGYYSLSISLPDCEKGMDNQGANYELRSWDREESREVVTSKELSHAARTAGWYEVGRVYLTASDTLQNLITLKGPTNGVCVVDAAKLEYIGAELPVESGSYRIDLNDKQQTILGLGVEIQSESLGSGNTMDETDLQHSVPHDLIQSERERLYTDMLSGFRYMRLAGGLFYRGTDEEQKHLVPHWPEQDEELAELLQMSGIEGFNFEFWSPTPYFKSSGKYHGGKLKCFDENWEYAASKVGQAKYEEEKQKFLEEFADTIIADFLRMRAAGLPVVQFSLQNEPPLKSVYGTYSFCTYEEQDYYEACKVVLPRLKAAFPDLFIHAPSWNGQHAGSSQMIKADAETLKYVDAWSHHIVGTSDQMLTSRDYLNRATAGLPVINTEFEYQPSHFTGQYDFRFVNTAQSIMNWMVFENSPTWFWLHCLKPLGNEESLGYGLGYWRKSGDTATYPVGNEVEQQHWDYNYPNFNALRGFLKYMPWDSVRYGVVEDEIRTDQRIMAWKSPEGQLAFAVTNRSGDSFRFDVDTTLADVTFDGYRLTSSSENFISLGTKTGAQISTTLKPYTIEFWVQRADADTMKKAESVTLDESTLTLAVGGTEQLKATVAPKDAPNINVRWTSSDSTVVRVDENGNLTALKEGTATITATAISGSGRIKASCDVTVSATSGHVHDWSDDWSKDENHHWYACSGCDEKKDEAPHVWGEGVVTKEATETEEGVKTYTCVCGSTKTERIPKLTPAPAPAPVTPVTPSEPASDPFNPNAGSNTAKFPFTDVPSNSWYYSSVKAAWENDLIDGVTANEFKPNATLTVAQTIKLAAALHQLDRTGEVSLKNGGANWHENYVNYAVVNGIIEKDYANYTKAQMNAPVTRGEFVHIFHGAKEAYKAINTVADNAIPDVKTTDKFAAEIYEFYRAGILTGSDAKGTFHSASTIKRSEAAAILLRMFEASARKSITLN